MATLEERMNSLEQGIGEIAKAIKEPVRPGPAVPQNAPGVLSTGVRGDKGFSFYNFLMKGLPTRDRGHAPYEFEVCSKFGQILQATNMAPNWAGSPGMTGHWLPTNLSMIPDLETTKLESELRFVKSAIASANANCQHDPDEEAWLLRKGYIRKANGISAYQDGYGGTVVAPPTQGPIVELIRPEAAALAAGATSIPLPPSGRYVEPRITGAPGATAVGEQQLALVTDMTTDQIEMTAKKITGAVVITDEATLFTSGTLDTYARMELNRTLGLKIDNYAFYGTGGNLIPAGITASQYNVTNGVLYFHSLTNPVPRGVGANGNTLLPEYGDIFEGLIADRSFGMDGQDGAWVMRPITFAGAAAYRADAVIPGDKAGAKVDILRRFNEVMPTMWGQKKVVRSTNILGTITKGSSGATLGDVFYAIWKYMLIGTYGAVNFKEGVVNDDLLKGRKTVIATMFGDIALRHPGAFGYYTAVLGANGML